MVHFLVQRGADIHAKTGKELQTPIHFAARNDATSSLKMLMKCGACITDKDFKQRTALQVCTNDWRQFSMLIRFCRKKKCISVGGCAIIDTISQSSCQKSTSVGAPPTVWCSPQDVMRLLLTLANTMIGWEISFAEWEWENGGKGRKEKRNLEEMQGEGRGGLKCLPTDYVWKLHFWCASGEWIL